MSGEAKAAKEVLKKAEQQAAKKGSEQAAKKGAEQAAKKGAEKQAGASGGEAARRKITSEDMRRIEEGVGGLYSGGDNAEEEENEDEEVAARTRTNKKLKKLGPLVAILVVTAGLLAGLGAVQSLMPTAIAKRLSQKYNSIDVSTSTTSDAWLPVQLDTGVRETALTNSQAEDAFALSSYQVEQFESVGMRVEDFGGCAAIVYEKPHLNTWYAVAGASCTGQAGGIEGVSRVVSVDEALADSDFSNSYTEASMSWRGGNSGWYDEMMSDVTEKKLGVTRDRWADYEATTGGEMTDAFKTTAASAIKVQTKDTEIVVKFKVECHGSEGTTWDVMDDNHTYKLGSKGKVFVLDMDIPVENKFEGNAKRWTLVGHYPTDVEQANGEVLTVVDAGYCKAYDWDDETGVEIAWDRTIFASDNGAKAARGDGSGASAYNASINELDDASAVGQALKNRAAQTSAVAATGGNRGSTCAKVDGVVSAYSVMSAYENVQFINLASGYLEAVDKMKAGYGNQSPVNEYSQILATPADTVMYDDAGNEVVREGKTAMESESMAWLFGSADMDTSDYSLKNVNAQAAMTSVASANGLSAEAYKQCGYGSLEGSDNSQVAQTGMDLISILGKSTDVVQKGIQVNIGYAIGQTENVFFSTVMTTAAKRTANLLLKDVATEWVGEDFGNALVSGGEKYISGNAVSGGQGPGNVAEVTAYLGQREVVLAQEAKYDRATKSPFDITSPNTFLGTIAYSLIPLAYSSGGIMSVLMNISSITSSAITALSPVATAVNINDEITSEGACPIPNGTNIVESGNCNAYIITDVSTIKTSPVKVVENVSDMLQNGKVGEGTDLARYITYCGQRSSQYNVKDTTIVNNLQDELNSLDNWFQKIVKAIIGLLPFIKDTQTVLQKIKNKELLQWATGEACMASDSNGYWKGQNGKVGNDMFQRYAENERLLENMNPGYTSPVTTLAKAYINEVTADDDTLEGVIARFAGMTVAEVSNTMDLIAYYLFLDGYDASTLYAFGADPVKVQRMLNLNIGEIGGNTYNIYWNQVEYADIRNRAVSMV